MGSKPLPGRKNIIITRQPGWKADGVQVVNSVDAAVALAASLNYNETFIIGGGEIYMIAFDKADKIYMTRVHTEPEGDAYFPVMEKNDWELVSNTENPADEKHAYAFSFQLWQRINNQ
jgi:dihydrofolate reductase